MCGLFLVIFQIQMNTLTQIFQMIVIQVIVYTKISNTNRPKIEEKKMDQGTENARGTMNDK